VSEWKWGAGGVFLTILIRLPYNAAAIASEGNRGFESLRAAVCIMRYPLEAAITEEHGSVQLIVNAAAPAGSGPEFRDTVTGTIVLTSGRAGIAAQGRLQTQATVACSRCTKEHKIGLEIEVSEECVLEDIDQPDAYQSAAAECSPIPILNGNELDLSELVRQLLRLNLPPRSLCKPDCAGICPHCGQNLNEGTCECNEEPADPRLSVLGDLLSSVDD
jgi:uncharacterized protein